MLRVRINVRVIRVRVSVANLCLAWAHDPARIVVPGAEHMTEDQVRIKCRVTVRVKVKVTAIRLRDMVKVMVNRVRLRKPTSARLVVPGAEHMSEDQVGAKFRVTVRARARPDIR